MTCALPYFFGFSVQLQRFYPKTVGFSPPYLQKRCTIYNKQTSFRKIPSVIYSEMEAPDPASGSMNSAIYQTLLRFSPSDLCNSCAQPCSESEWNFSIEDGVNGFKGHNSFQGKEPEKISKSGRVSYRRSINRVSFS